MSGFKSPKYLAYIEHFNRNLKSLTFWDILYRWVDNDFLKIMIFRTLPIQKYVFLEGELTIWDNFEFDGPPLMAKKIVRDTLTLWKNRVNVAG